MKTFREYAFNDLTQDKYFNLLDKEDIIACLNKAILNGKQEAKFYYGKDLEEELKSNNIKLIYSNDDSDYDGLIIYARTILTSDITIEIFNKAIEKKYLRLKQKGIDISLEDLKNLHLAHEFYHALEYKNKKETSDEFIVYQKFLCFKFKRKLKSLNEIAANSFAYYYLDEKIIPQSTDD